MFKSVQVGRILLFPRYLLPPGAFSALQNAFVVEALPGTQLGELKHSPELVAHSQNLTPALGFPVRPSGLRLRSFDPCSFVISEQK